MNLTHLLIISATALTGAVAAQPLPAGAAATARGTLPTAAAAPQSEGEVRKVDIQQAKLTLRHGPLQNLEMPAMTMVFKAADPKMLEGLKEGDKVKFTAEKINGAFTVTAIQIDK